MTLTRVVSTLPADFETLIERTIGCCLDVHRELGPGMNEAAYSRACCIEMEAQGIEFELEKLIQVRYRGQLICHQRIDLFVANQLVLEIKSVDHIHPVHLAQTVSYMRAIRSRAGRIVNFNVPILKQGIRRVVL